MENEEDDDGGFPDSITRDFAMALDAAWLKTKDATFAEMVTEYKSVESAFTLRAADNAEYVLEMRRGVAESILSASVNDLQPFDICRACWEDVVRLGFSAIECRCTYTWYFVECCRRNKRTEMGLQVVAPLLDELQRLLDDPKVDEGYAEYYQEQIQRLAKLRAKLEAQRAAMQG